MKEFIFKTESGNIRIQAVSYSEACITLDLSYPTIKILGAYMVIFEESKPM